MTAPTRRLSVVVLTVVAAALSASAAYADSESYTVLPELQTATVVSTTPAAQASDARPTGTTIAYRFDETLDATTPEPSGFALYDEQGDRFGAAEVTVQDDTVTAVFPDLDTDAESSSLQVAVSEAGAVHDAAGAASPIGSVGLLRWTSRRASGPQDCLRLNTADRLRHVHGNTLLRVGFSSRPIWFSACSGLWVGYHPHGIRLQMVDGRVVRAVRVRRVSTDPLRATAIFPGVRPRARIARLVVQAGAVDYAYDDGSESEVDITNVLQARAVSHAGDSVRPDLVSVRLLPSSQPDQPDQAVFVFDQRVSRPVAGRFRLNDVARGTRAVVPPARPRTVRVTFGPDATDDATFATVRPGAVRGGTADEVAVPNVLWSTRYSPPHTALPELEFVVSTNATRAGGTVVTSAWWFDTTLTSDVATEAFKLYDKAGVRYDADRCVVTNTKNGEEVVGKVTCTFPAAPGTGAFLATVTAGAVHDDTGQGNPEAADYTSLG